MSIRVREPDSAAVLEASADEAKRARILQAGMKSFLAYGYSRVTMDQIAQMAEMSRPALYLLFRNKADIYRALAAKVVGESFQKARLALAADGEFGDRVNAAVETCMISTYADIAASPHGAEILDAKSTLASDLLLGWKRDLGGIIQSAIEKEAARTGVDLAVSDLSAEILSQFLLDGIEGMKHRLSDPDQQRKAVRGLIKIVERALQR